MTFCQMKCAAGRYCACRKSMGLGWCAEELRAARVDGTSNSGVVELNQPGCFDRAQATGTPKNHRAGDIRAPREYRVIAGIDESAARAHNCVARDAIDIDRAIGLESRVEPNRTLNTRGAKK